MRIDPLTGGQGLRSLPEAIRLHLLTHCGKREGKRIWLMVEPAITNWRELADQQEADIFDVLER